VATNYVTGEVHKLLDIRQVETIKVTKTPGLVPQNDESWVELDHTKADCTAGKSGIDLKGVLLMKATTELDVVRFEFTDDSKSASRRDYVNALCKQLGPPGSWYTEKDFSQEFNTNFQDFMRKNAGTMEDLHAGTMEDLRGYYELDLKQPEIDDEQQKFEDMMKAYKSRGRRGNVKRRANVNLLGDE
jgi:hypothetical protein